MIHFLPVPTYSTKVRGLVHTCRADLASCISSSTLLLLLCKRREVQVSCLQSLSTFFELWQGLWDLLAAFTRAPDRHHGDRTRVGEVADVNKKGPELSSTRHSSPSLAELLLRKSSRRFIGVILGAEITANEPPRWRCSSMKEAIIEKTPAKLLH